MLALGSVASRTFRIPPPARFPINMPGGIDNRLTLHQRVIPWTITNTSTRGTHDNSWFLVFCKLDSYVSYFIYSRFWYRHRATLINFWNFFQGLHLFIKKAQKSIIWFDGICFFKGLCLMFLPNVPGAMFISESRVIKY